MAVRSCVRTRTGHIWCLASGSEAPGEHPGNTGSPADLPQAQEAGPGTRPMVGQNLSVAPQEMLEEARDKGRAEELAALPTPLPGIVDG